jgi:hypothetical protein
MVVCRRFEVALLVAALPACLAASPSQARYSPKKAIWGPAYVNGVSQFPRYRELGVGIYEQSMSWANVAPVRPRHPRNPRDPAYHWPTELVRAVVAAQRNGMRVALEIIGAPPWSNGGRPWNWAPRRPSDFANFAYAASRRFPGVHLWLIWGEPSRQPNFMPLVRAPTGTRLTPAEASAPRRYARLLDAAYGELKRASRRNQVVGGMTYTTGDISAWQWIPYMRLPNGLPPRMDLYGHNPFTWRAPDFGAAPSCCGLSDFNDLPRLRQLINRNLRRRGQAPLRLFLSEFFLPTAPDSEINVWVDPPVQAQWISSILAIVRGTPWIAALGWIHFYDDPPDPGGARVSHGGLIYYDGTPKPGYYAFRDG